MNGWSVGYCSALGVGGRGVLKVEKQNGRIDRP